MFPYLWRQTNPAKVLPDLWKVFRHCPLHPGLLTVDAEVVEGVARKVHHLRLGDHVQTELGVHKTGARLRHVALNYVGIHQFVYNITISLSKSQNQIIICNL
jgi:hypothetical protein